MVNPWRKARISSGLVRFISRLRSKRTESLVVQTGFPTSLAGIVVKNHSRLRKSSGKPSQLPPISLPDSLHDRRQPRIADGEPPPDLVPVRVGIEKRRSRVWVSAAKVVPFIVLAIVGKRVVAGVTIWALILWILEIVGRWVYGSRDEGKVVGLVIGDRDRVSQVQEVEFAENCVDLVQCEKISEEFIAELSRDEKEANLDSLKIHKQKKHWKKLVPKKLRKRKGLKDGSQVELVPNVGLV
ncbi:hypothetical protein IHE45_15G039500 [Dioscorea alata]|uniref:Uncharacterized protein n=1 Tax=Dioscorea alata TaxID=55571 RepID=A0ACB7UL01_DIOAL|nr:hypothetical protein IHE45_15G039500 [Dioscorea alata]